MKTGKCDEKLIEMKRELVFKTILFSVWLVVFFCCSLLYFPSARNLSSVHLKFQSIEEKIKNKDDHFCSMIMAAIFTLRLWPLQ